MKHTNLKSMIAKVMTVGLLAGTVALAAPVKAEAQGVAFGLQVGYPRYDSSRQDFFEHQRRIEAQRRAEFERREAIRRHEEWERSHFHGRGFDGRDGRR